MVSTDIDRVMKYIDWNPFFALWNIKGKYPNRSFPKIFNDERAGEQARKLYEEALALIKLHGRALSLLAAVAFYPAAAKGDDIVLYTDESRSTVKGTFFGLRQQTGEAPYMCLSDFVAPVRAVLMVVEKKRNPLLGEGVASGE